MIADAEPSLTWLKSIFAIILGFGRSAAQCKAIFCLYLVLVELVLNLCH